MLESFKSGKFEYKKLSLEEQKQRGILGRLVGCIADFKNPTRNGRRYSETLWTNVFNDKIMQERINNHLCMGELGHPEDRSEIDMEKVAICLAEVPKKGPDGKLYGVFDILSTPCGKILKSLCDYGCNIGISSRGEGDLITGYDGQEEVDPDTYQCTCFDAVAIPAVAEARLKYVTESLDKTRYNKTLRQSLQESLNKANESDRKIMEESLSSLGIKLNEEDEIEDAELENSEETSYNDNEENIDINGENIPASVSDFTDKLPVIELGDKYFYINLINGKIQAGSTTNTGFISEYEVKYNPEESFDENLQALYDKIIEENPELLDIQDESLNESGLPDEKAKWTILELPRDVQLTSHGISFIQNKNNTFYSLQAAQRRWKEILNNCEKNKKADPLYFAMWELNPGDAASTNVKTCGNFNSYSEWLDAMYENEDIQDESLNINEEDNRRGPVNSRIGLDMTFTVNNALSNQIDQIFGDRIKNREVLDKNKIQYTIPFDKDLEALANRIPHIGKQIYQSFDNHPRNPRFKTIINDSFNINEEQQNTAVDNNEAMVEELQNLLKVNADLEQQVMSLQEKLSVCYAKEAKVEETANKYKQYVKTLAESAKEAKALQAKITKLEEKLTESKSAEEGLRNKLTEAQNIINSSSAKSKSLKESISSKNSEMAKLNESIDDLKSELSQVNEELNVSYETLKEAEAKHNKDIRINKRLKEKLETETAALNESIAQLQKDNNLQKAEFNQKLDRAQKLVEKYKKATATAVDKYIELQAIRLGSTVNEVKNRLPESYSFSDIDKACEGLQAYNLSMSRLPINTLQKKVINESVRVKGTSSKNESILPVSRFDDEIDEGLLYLAGK